MGTENADLTDLRVEVRFGAVALARLVGSLPDVPHDDLVVAGPALLVSTPSGPEQVAVVAGAQGRRPGSVMSVVSGSRHATG